jgi:hypothetical protein
MLKAEGKVWLARWHIDVTCVTYNTGVNATREMVINT